MVTVGHLLLYLPSMFIVGVFGSSHSSPLPSYLSLACGLVVYSEFLIQPLALLLISPKIRSEVTSSVYSTIYKHVTKR